MKGIDLTRLLFEAHRDANEELFIQTAQSIIGRELSANHHHEAQELIRALGADRQRIAERRKLTHLPARNSNMAIDALLLQRNEEHIKEPVLPPTIARKVHRIVAEHRNREKLLAHGLRPATRILFWGPPGNGKTLTAHFIAQQVHLPIGTANLSGIFSSLLGATATQLSSIFKDAAERPMVLFLDEFDALAKERDDDLEIGEPKRIVNSLLQNIDTFVSTRSLLIAATNHQYLLDSAVWRRFDAIIGFPLPGTGERELHLKRLLSGIKVTGGVAKVAAAAEKLSFADLTSTIDESLKTMVLENRKAVRAADLVSSLQERRRSVSGARRPRRARINE